MPEYDPPKGQPRNPSYEPYGAAGGGGAGGTYVFTDLAHLDTIIARWQSVRERIEASRNGFERAVLEVYPPAKDQASRQQAEALIASVRAAAEHNISVLGYVKRYVERLETTRVEYAATEEVNTDRLKAVDEDGDQ